MYNQTLFSYTDCRLCPRECRIDRTENIGFCQCRSRAGIARAALHMWEEPCISGTRGSGTVFFSGCTLRCCFCQNSRISREHFGVPVTPRQLADIFLNLQAQGAHNINLVTPTQYLPDILPALELAKPDLAIPIVYNCGGYEKVETVEALRDFVDIWLPDLKYMDAALSMRYSAAPDYFEKTSKAIQKMIEVTGTPVFRPLSDVDSKPRTLPSKSPSCFASSSPSVLPKTGSGSSSVFFHGIPEQPENFLMQRGVIIRHLVLPGSRKDSVNLLHWIKNTLPEGQYLLSLMSQYTPYHKDTLHPELNRRITSYEYQSVVDTALELGLDHGFMQQKSSAKEEYTPPFDLEGCPVPD
ncbi:MAG: radical SAM protein [bacterium]|nr:radical SAM protein [bacterium]